MIVARIFYFLYFSGVAFLVFASLSALIFNSRFTAKDFLINAVLSLIWPLALFSKSGRTQLFSLIRKDIL